MSGGRSGPRLGTRRNQDDASPRLLGCAQDAARQAAVVAHVAAHELGAAAYALRAVMEAAPKPEREAAQLAELGWQKEQLPVEIRELVLDDMRLRNDICWNIFEANGD